MQISEIFWLLVWLDIEINLSSTDPNIDNANIQNLWKVKIQMHNQTSPFPNIKLIIDTFSKYFLFESLKWKWEDVSVQAPAHFLTSDIWR